MHIIRIDSQEIARLPPNFNDTQMLSKDKIVDILLFQLAPPRVGSAKWIVKDLTLSQALHRRQQPSWNALKFRKTSTATKR